MLDILIIGSGPAGLSAAVYAKRANLDVLLAEKEYMGTGQIAESHQVDNYLGLPGENGFDLGERFLEHAKSLGVNFFEGEAESYEAIDGGWKVTFDTGDTKTAKAIIYCAGATHRSLNVEGERAFSGKGISYCAVCDGAFYKDKDVAVIGGGDTALDDALYLSDICKKVYLVHRRDAFRGARKTVEILSRKENVEFVLNANVKEFTGNEKLQGIRLDNGNEIPVEGVFIAIGMEPKTEGLKDIVNLDENGYVIADESGKTSAKGFFVAGDVRTKKLRQVVTAISDGANAATEASIYLAM